MLSDAVRPERLDLAMLLALEAAKEGDTLEARGSLQRALDARPEVVRFLHVPEGDVMSVAFGPEGQIAAGYAAAAAAAAAWCSSTPGRAAPARAAGGQGGRGQEGDLRAGGRTSPPDMTQSAPTSARGVMVLFDASGERLPIRRRLWSRRASVTSVAFGPEGQIAAGYSGVPRPRRRGAL